MSDENLQEKDPLDAAADAADTGANGAETAVADSPPTLEEQLQTAQAEAAKNYDGWLRAQAELSNARKRFEKQQADAYTNATAAVIKKLLPVLDDFQRAMENAPTNIQEDSWFEGIILVQRKLNSILESFNVEPIVAVGQPFDPNLHEAIMQEESDTYESGVVTRELQKGYKLGDRVIRPTLVNVAA
ncbi:MAG: nucleotide exchange factor GrpE [Ardenticatenaceae bacterium]|nr:nucleotide exchange factor GrpE [Anaerolineales bacterium]MCB8966708.1 nucleotide exchange factor GrpE [Ardenticatenaceae bacterium]MCB8989142.1 nucleotide exchange factor GrpE [Ardenticatenaceae bacterium]